MLGNFLSIWIGPTLPVPAPAELMANFEQASVQLSDDGRSGFQMTFRVGRDLPLGVVDYPPLLKQLLKPGFRVVLFSTINAIPYPLCDGIITNVQLSPSTDASGSKLTVQGKDIAVMMELVEKKVPRPGLPVLAVVNAILAMYAVYQITPLVIQPPGDTPPLVTEKMPLTDGSDFTVLNELAKEFGYVFWVQAGPLPLQNTAYWGPPITNVFPQRALSFKVGWASNLGSVSFTNDATKPVMLAGLIQDRFSQLPLPVIGLPVNVPLASLPAWVGNAPFLQVKALKNDAGGDYAKAFATALGEAAKASQSAVTASGDLDVGAYGTVLRAREIVGIRGVGLTFDGLWYVKSVTHTISPGSHKQSFNLEREGTLSNTPMVLA